MGSIPGQETKILVDVWHSQKKRKKKKDWWEQGSVGLGVEEALIRCTIGGVGKENVSFPSNAYSALGCQRSILTEFHLPRKGEGTHKKYVCA